MTFHKAIEYTLKENDRPMTVEDIVDEINERKYYSRNNRESIRPEHIYIYTN